jgi:heme-degrading monooxygenase HmoA
MIYVIYKWSVSLADKPEFLSRWSAVTQSIHKSVDGALGSFCIGEIGTPTEILTIAKWESHDQWLLFIAQAKTGAMKSLHDIAKQISVTAYDELGNYLV